MIELVREQLRRDLSDALHAIQQDQDVPGLEGFPARLRALEPTYQYHAPLLQVAITKHDTLAIMWHLVQVVAKLEGRQTERGGEHGAKEVIPATWEGEGQAEGHSGQEADGPAACQEETRQAKAL